MNTIKQKLPQEHTIEKNEKINVKLVFFALLAMWIVWCSKDNWPKITIWKTDCDFNKPIYNGLLEKKVACTTPVSIDEKVSIVVNWNKFYFSRDNWSNIKGSPIVNISFDESKISVSSKDIDKVLVPEDFEWAKVTNKKIHLSKWKIHWNTSPDTEIKNAPNYSIKKEFQKGVPTLQKWVSANPTNKQIVDQERIANERAKTAKKHIIENVLKDFEVSWKEKIEAIWTPTYSFENLPKELWEITILARKFFQKEINTAIDAIDPNTEFTKQFNYLIDKGFNPNIDKTFGLDLKKLTSKEKQFLNFLLDPNNKKLTISIYNLFIQGRTTEIKDIEWNIKYSLYKEKTHIKPILWIKSLFWFDK